MASVWSTFTFVLLPPAIIILILLTVPFPSFLEGRIVQLVDLVFGLRVGTIRVFRAITILALVVLIAQTFELQKRYASVAASASNEMTSFGDLQKKASRWRAERNWWISALTFSIYWMSLRFHAVKKELVEYHQQHRQR